MLVELASRYTSYVAVDPKEQTSLKECLMMMKSRDVPNTLAHGWGGHGLQSRTFSRMACGEFGGHTGLVTLSGEISLINCAIFCSASAYSAILCDYAGSDGWVWRRFV